MNDMDRAMSLELSSADANMVLPEMIRKAVTGPSPGHDLSDIYAAVNTTDIGSSLEPLDVLPHLISRSEEPAAKLIDLMVLHSNPREFLLAIQEVLELIVSAIGEPEEDEDEDEDEDGLVGPEAAAVPLSPAEQLDRVIRLFAEVMPRVPKRNKTTSETIRPYIMQIQKVISGVGSEVHADECRLIPIAVWESTRRMYQWIEKETVHDEGEKTKCQDVLYGLLSSTLESCAACMRSDIAEQAFQKHFGRFVVHRNPVHEQDSSNESYDSSVHGILDTSMIMGINVYTLPPSLSSLVLLAHAPPTPPSLDLHALTTYLPVILSTISSPHAPALYLDSSLALLASTFSSLTSRSQLPDLPPEIVVPLEVFLPTLAISHPDPLVRHLVYRVIGVMVRLMPDMNKLEFLKQLLQGGPAPDMEQGMMEQGMRIAAIKLLKDLLLESLARDKPSSESKLFTSPELWKTLAPVIFRPNPPDLLDSNTVDWEEVTESGEDVRLVECLTLFFLVANRDTANLTGIRKPDMLKGVEQNILVPLRENINVWSKGLEESTQEPHSHVPSQLAVLGMWIDRVQATIDDMRMLSGNSR